MKTTQIRDNFRAQFITISRILPFRIPVYNNSRQPFASSSGRSSCFLSLSPLVWQKVTGAAALSILCNSITELTRLVRLTGRSLDKFRRPSKTGFFPMKVKRHSHFLTWIRFIWYFLIIFFFKFISDSIQKRSSIGISFARKRVRFEFEEFRRSLEDFCLFFFENYKDLNLFPIYF